MSLQPLPAKTTTNNSQTVDLEGANSREDSKEENAIRNGLSTMNITINGSPSSFKNHSFDSSALETEEKQATVNNNSTSSMMNDCHTDDHHAQQQYLDPNYSDSSPTSPTENGHAL